MTYEKYDRGAIIYARTCAQVENVTDTLSINHNWLNGANMHMCWQLLQEERDRIARELMNDDQECLFQEVDVCYGVLQCVAVCCSALQCVAVCCSVLQCVAVCCSVLQRVAVCCSVLQCVAVCCSVLQCAAVCCSVLQCVAVCCSARELSNDDQEDLSQEVNVC